MSAYLPWGKQKAVQKALWHEGGSSPASVLFPVRTKIAVRLIGGIPPLEWGRNALATRSLAGRSDSGFDGQLPESRTVENQWLYLGMRRHGMYLKQDNLVVSSLKFCEQRTLDPQSRSLDEHSTLG